MNKKTLNKETSPAHSLTLKDRKALTMDGIKEVLNFNENKILLQTNQGLLDIKGKELNIQKLNLDNGSIEIEGYILSLDYAKKTSKKGFINKLFK